MALTSDKLYEAMTSFQVVLDGRATQIREGTILLGQKVPAAVEGLFVLVGSTPAEKAAARVAAGLPASSGDGS